MIIHHKKILPEYFQAVIEGRKPFEVRENDENYKVGERVILEEYRGFEDIPDCPKWGRGCPQIEFDPSTESDEFVFPEDCQRHQCVGYRKHIYTGRRCLIKIKEIFDLTKAGLDGWVAFTFDILNITDKQRESK